MKRTKIKLSLVKLSAIKHVESDKGYIILPIKEITDKLKKYILKAFRGETAFKKTGYILDVYPIEHEEEIYIVAEVRKVTAKPKTQEEVKAIISPQQTTQKGETK